MRGDVLPAGRPTAQRGAAAAGGAPLSRPFLHGEVTSRFSLLWAYIQIMRCRRAAGAYHMVFHPEMAVRSRYENDLGIWQEIDVQQCNLLIILADTTAAGCQNINSDAQTERCHAPGGGGAGGRGGDARSGLAAGSSGAGGAARGVALCRGRAARAAAAVLTPAHCGAHSPYVPSCCICGFFPAVMRPLLLLLHTVASVNW